MAKECLVNCPNIEACALSIKSSMSIIGLTDKTQSLMDAVEDSYDCNGPVLVEETVDRRLSGLFKKLGRPATKDISYYVCPVEDTEEE